MQYRSLIHMQLQMPKTTISKIVFKLILKSLKGNILTSFILLLKNLWKTIAICINTDLIITLILTQYILLSC